MRYWLLPAAIPFPNALSLVTDPASGAIAVESNRLDGVQLAQIDCVRVAKTNRQDVPIRREGKKEVASREALIPCRGYEPLPGIAPASARIQRASFYFCRSKLMTVQKKVPFVTFLTRVHDKSVQGPNPYRWQEKTSDDYFAGKRVILFSLPGAFTPTCSTYQLPKFEELYDQFAKQGIDAIYCVSVNDAFVMNAWGKSLGLKQVQLIPDGSGEFTRKMGMLVAKDNLGFGMRSWRYAALINNGVVEHWFEEEGFSDNCEADPYGVSSPQNVLETLKAAA